MLVDDESDQAKCMKLSWKRYVKEKIYRKSWRGHVFENQMETEGDEKMNRPVYKELNMLAKRALVITCQSALKIYGCVAL